ALPFVGRDDEIQRLHARLLEAKQHKGGFCLLVGEAGIDKTRCMDELAVRAAAEGFSVWTGRSVEDAWARVFWPWIQIVRSATASAPGAELYAAVHRATAGNPLFLQQTIRTLVARHGEHALASLSPTQIEPPAVARDVLGAALQRLDAETRALLELASVLGET